MTKPDLVTGDVGEARRLAEIRAYWSVRGMHDNYEAAVRADQDVPYLLDLIEAVRVEEKALAASDRHQAASNDASEPSEGREAFRVVYSPTIDDAVWCFRWNVREVGHLCFDCGAERPRLDSKFPREMDTGHSSWCKVPRLIAVVEASRIETETRGAVRPRPDGGDQIQDITVEVEERSRLEALIVAAREFQGVFHATYPMNQAAGKLDAALAPLVPDGEHAES